MSTYKEHLLLNLQREILLLKRLTAIIREKDLDFRPMEKVRSTRELMQYLSGIGANMMRAFTEDLSAEARQKMREYTTTATLDNIQLRLDEQWAAIEHAMSLITEEDLLSREVELPWKEKMALGAAIMHAPLRWLATYRMQLFIQLKMSGHDELGTADAWVMKMEAVD